MNNRLLLFVVLFFVLGSGVVSSLNSLSYTFKTAFYIIAMVVLATLGLVYLFKNKRNKIKQ